jgi:hypothetical protein
MKSQVVFIALTSRKKRLPLNISKTNLIVAFNNFLGYEVSTESLRLSADRLMLIRELKIPDTPQKLQSFVGFVTFCSRFVENRSAIEKVLNELKLFKSRKFSSDEFIVTQERCLMLKCLLLDDLILNTPPNGNLLKK